MIITFESVSFFIAYFRSGAGNAYSPLEKHRLEDVRLNHDLI
jgi:hypothetical protein